MARMIRLLSRHVRYDTQLVVLASRKTGAASFIAVDDPQLCQRLEDHLCHGLQALGLLAFDREGNRLDEKHFSFPWLQNDPETLELFERICRRQGNGSLGPGDSSIGLSRIS